jgi:hypothetical protein
MKDYKTSIQTILMSSSLQFLLSPFRRKHLVFKIIWICFLLISFLASIVCVGLNINDYLKYDKTTSIETISESESQFPTVSFCNDKNQRQFDINLIEFWFSNVNLKMDWNKHLEIYNDTVFGKCFRFNSIKPIKTLTAGSFGIEDGLWLDFYFNNNDNNNLGSLLVYIHNHTQTPISIYNKGYYLSSGNLNKFSVKRIFDQKLDYPFSKCIKDLNVYSFNKTIFDYFSKKNIKYTKKDCIVLCRNLIYNQISDCTSDCYLNDLDEKFLVKCYDLQQNNTQLIKCVEKYLSIFNVAKCKSF